MKAIKIMISTKHLGLWFLTNDDAPYVRFRLSFGVQRIEWTHCTSGVILFESYFEYPKRYITMQYNSQTPIVRVKTEKIWGFRPV